MVTFPRCRTELERWIGRRGRWGKGGEGRGEEGAAPSVVKSGLARRDSILHVALPLGAVVSVGVEMKELVGSLMGAVVGGAPVASVSLVGAVVGGAPIAPVDLLYLFMKGPKAFEEEGKKGEASGLRLFFLS